MTLKILSRLIATTILLVSATLQAESGNVDWQGWEFDYSTDSGTSGLTLTNVYYNNRQILHSASFPVMRVQYENDVCGPYADLLWRDVYQPVRVPGTSCDGNHLCQRTYTQDGENWLEIGANAQIGEYQIYQVYLFNKRGFFDSLVFSRGLQCNVDHTHHAHWLFDFDIDGAKHDQVFKNSGNLQTDEFNDLRSQTEFWSVQDKNTGNRVEIRAGVDDGFPDPFSQWDVAVRRYKNSETGNWRMGPRGEIGNLYNENQDIDGRDIVFWYVSHLEHSALEGSDIWHFSGPRITVVAP